MDDADRRITSFAVADNKYWFAIAYYWHIADLLPEELRIRTFDRRTKVWRSAVLDREALRGGSALRIARAKGAIYLDLHINPSAGALIVLTENLRVRKRLYGWSSLILTDGRVVYEDSMVHFAPFHAASVSLYDPATNRAVRLYPRSAQDASKTAPIDRAIGDIEQRGKDRISILVIEQRLKWADNTRAAAAGPEVSYTVSCVLSTPPACATGPKKPVPKDRQVFGRWR